MLRLVPTSGVQFVDIRLSLGSSAATRHHFIEETLGAQRSRRVLLPIEGDGFGNAVVWHPVTMLPVPPQRVLSISEADAMKTFAGRWVPLPYLRITGRGASGNASYDNGPTSWARVFISAPSVDDEGGTRADAVLAFDTAIDGPSRVDAADYLGPTREDVVLGSTFALASTVDAVGCILRETWLIDWLRHCFVTSAERQARHDNGDAPFALEHVGHYFALLRALQRCPQLPQLRFADTMSSSLPAISGVDLILDIGSEETAALLVAAGMGVESTQLLSLRDMTEPTVVHRGTTFATAVEFDRLALAIEPYSHRGRRRRAFLWPSLVRVGAEARRLAMRGGAVERVTGLGGLKDHIADTDPSTTPWRYSGASQGLEAPGAIVTHPILAKLSEEGERLSATAPQGLPAVRARFSRSSMTTLFVAEVLLHALSQINAPDREEDPRHWHARRLQNIILTAPLAMPETEQKLLVRRVGDAVAMVWEGLGLDDAVTPRPAITVAADANTGAQLLHLFETVRGEFGGRFGDMSDLVKRRHNGRRWLRLTSIEADTHSVSLVTIDYPEAVDGSVTAETFAFERLARGTECVLSALVDSWILPSLARALHDARASDAYTLLDELSGKIGRGHLIDDPYFVSRFGSRVLRPAAAGLLGLYQRMASITAPVPRHVSLATLVSLGGGSVDLISGQLDAMAARAGFRGLRLEDVSLVVDRERLSDSVRKALAEAVRWASDLAGSHGADLMLLGDRLSRIPDATAMMLARLPVPASRIVALHGRQLTTFEGFEATPVGDRGRLVGVVSAFLANRDLFQAGNFRIIPVHAGADATTRRTRHGTHGSATSPPFMTAASGAARQA